MYSAKWLQRALGVFLLALAASGGGNAAEREKAPPAPRKAASVLIDDSPVPSRFTAPLPASVPAMRQWLRSGETPPRAHVLDLLATGDPTWLSRLGIASKAIPDAEHLAWARLWQAALEMRPVTPRFCSATRSIMNAAPSAQRAALAGTFTRHCATKADTAAVLREDTPPWAVVFFFDPFDVLIELKADVPPYHPRFGAAVREIILAPPGEPDTDIMETPRSVAFTMAAHPDPRAVEALLEIHAQIRDRKVADQVAMAFSSSTNAKGKALLAAACKRQKDDPVCDGGMNASDLPSLANANQAPDAKTTAKVRRRIAELQAMGFTHLEGLDPTNVSDENVGWVLTEARVAVGFDAETDMFPNEHDTLLRSLSMLVGTSLEDVVFEERAPGAQDPRAPYELTAYSHGKRFRRRAENLGDWYDLAAVLDLLNAVAAERQLPERFHMLATLDQNAMVVAAPPSAIAKAVKARLIEIGDPGQAEANGKEFEDSVRKGLLKEPD